MQSVPSSLVHKIAPVSPDGKGPHPALILLHGRGANEDDLLGLTPYFDPRFLVIAARAPLEFPYGGCTWYETLTVGTPEPSQFAESYARLIQFIDDVRRHYPVDPDRLFLLGFSMGAVMAYACALTRPESVHSIVAHSGYIPEDTPLVFQWNKLRGKGFFVAHGESDPVIGASFARRAKELLADTEADLEYREYPIPHTMSEESVGDLSSWLRIRME
jgi:phospholipase/carboxylesterase